MDCQGRLRQVAIGLHSYHDTYGVFPLAAGCKTPGDKPNKSLPVEKRFSWMATILPFCGGGGLNPLSEADFSKAWDTGSNLDWTLWHTPGEKEVGYREPPRTRRPNTVFFCHCPLRKIEVAPDVPDCTHYVGIAGVGSDAALLPKEDRRAGFFGYDRVIRQQDIEDWLSTTLAVIETCSSIGPWVSGGTATVRPFDPS